MRTSGSRTYLSQTPVPKMPPGLVDLMEGITKEVLRKNPTDIYEFCTAHMRKLLDIRDGLAQEKVMPIEIKQANVLNQHEIRPEKYRDTCKENVSLINNCGFKENLYSEKELKESADALIQNDFKTPLHHEMDLIEASKIEIVQEFINPGNIEKRTLANIFENNVIIADENCIKTENTQIADSNCLQMEERYPTGINETTNTDTTSVINTRLTSNIGNVKETEILEDNQSKSLDYMKIVKEENIQASVTNEMYMSEKDGINVMNLLQKEIHISSNCIIESANHAQGCLTHLNLAENTLNIASVEHVLRSHNVNELYNTNVDIKNMIIDNNVPSIDELQKADQKQVIPLFDDTVKEENSCDVKIMNEINEFEYNNQSLMKKQGSETKEEVHDCIFYNIDISKEEVITLKTDEPNNSSVKNLTSVEIDSNADAYTHSTNENNNVSDNTNMFNNVKDLEADHLEELHSNLHFEQKLEDHIILSENENYNLQMKPGNKSNNDEEQLITAQHIKETGVDKQTLQKIKDVAPTHSSEISPDHGVIVEETKSINNSEKVRGNDKQSCNMDLETAAITIQKVFRSFLYKSRGSTFEDVANDENILNNKEMDIYTSQNKERRSLGITRIDSVLQTVNEEKSLSLSTDDSSTLSSAATIIQAHVRGFLLRNKINSGKTLSMNSLINSDGHAVTSSDDGDHHQKNKTVLNIHIVPEAENKSFSRDETVITSVDLSLDCSPPTSINLHPLGYDKSEPRKQLKREDAFQSISPPSNNSSKLSEDIDVRESINNDNVHEKSSHGNVLLKNDLMERNMNHVVTESNDSLIAVTSNTQQQKETKGLTKMSSDESDVVTPFVEQNSEHSIADVDNTSKLIHSGEFHDVVVPTKVTRSDTTVVRGE